MQAMNNMNNVAQYLGGTMTKPVKPVITATCHPKARTKWFKKIIQKNK